MKTLLLYYTLSGKTKLMCDSLQTSIFADAVSLRPRRPYSFGSAYLFGALNAIRNAGCPIFPVEEDVSSYSRILLAAPVWAAHPAPPMVEFLRSYDLAGKEVHALLSYSRDGSSAATVLKNEIEKAGGHCATVACIRSSAALMRQLRTQNCALTFDPEQGIQLDEIKPN